jgi:hypothetical protein
MNKERTQRLGQQVLALVQETRQKYAEGERQLAVLEMQAHVMCQGIEVHDVESYGYDPKLDKRPIPLKSVLRLKLIGPRKEQQWREANPVYNYVIMKDGNRIDMEPVAVPNVPKTL